MKHEDFFDLGFEEPGVELTELPIIGYRHKTLPFGLFVDEDGFLVMEGYTEFLSTKIKATKKNVNEILTLFKKLNNEKRR